MVHRIRKNRGHTRWIVKTLYLDNAATSWPKPKSVLESMRLFFIKGGGNPGRSGHGRSIGAARIVVQTRELLACLLNVRDSSKIVFTKNATEALNIAIYGLVGEGGHIVTSSMEHNSVMRPLTDLQNYGREVTVVQANAAGTVNPDDVARALREHTCLVVLTHASNVTGAVNDIAGIGEVCRDRGVPLLIDAAQTAGCVPIDVEAMCIDFLAFSGHKGLLGPQGTGGLYIGSERLSEPLMRGGTGSLSDREEQPDFFPDRFESGTLNVIGIAGLGAGVEYVLNRGISAIADHDGGLLQLFLDELCNDRRYQLYGRCAEEGAQPESRTDLCIKQTGVLSLNIAGLSPSKVGQTLDREYGIQTRVGLHCAPSAHRTIGTFPDGTVRLSWGPFTTEKDVRRVVRALHAIAENEAT
ncbi:MAG: aminotransferase class V-fold PLP-dependent enzyme [Spirochaetes bacterium]|nr:aminotransferase class V-fold PLP-dependent enzyme [Spirochaetota bacterium]